MDNPFFKNTGPYDINNLLKLINLKGQNFSEEKINDIKDLYSSQNKDITFFNSIKYKSLLKKTKASFCITSKNFEKFIPEKCKPLIVKNVFFKAHVSCCC